MKLITELPVGVNYNGKKVKEFAYLPSNGVSEKVFTDKLPENPYTWMAKVATIALAYIGDVKIGYEAREIWLKTEEVTPPPIVLDLSLCDVNTLLVDIHRTVWENIIPQQEVVCRYCARAFKMDIDLNRIEMDEKDQADIDNGVDFSQLIVELVDGYTHTSLRPASGGSEDIYDGAVFNKLVFRLPLLRDAVRHEKYINDTTTFWRRIAFDTLEKIVRVEDGKEVLQLPDSERNKLGLGLFNNLLSSRDLKKIRTTLRETGPMLPFFYEETCPNCKKRTPVTIEPGSFFTL